MKLVYIESESNKLPGPSGEGIAAGEHRHVVGILGSVGVLHAVAEAGIAHQRLCYNWSSSCVVKMQKYAVISRNVLLFLFFKWCENAKLIVIFWLMNAKICCHFEKCVIVSLF